MNHWPGVRWIESDTDRDTGKLTTVDIYMVNSFDVRQDITRFCETQPIFFSPDCIFTIHSELGGNLVLTTKVVQFIRGHVKELVLILKPIVFKELFNWGEFRDAVEHSGVEQLVVTESSADVYDPDGLSGSALQFITRMSRLKRVKICSPVRNMVPLFEALSVKTNLEGVKFMPVLGPELTEADEDVIASLFRKLPKCQLSFRFFTEGNMDRLFTKIYMAMADRTAVYGVLRSGRYRHSYSMWGNDKREKWFLSEPELGNYVTEYVNDLVQNTLYKILTRDLSEAVRRRVEKFF